MTRPDVYNAIMAIPGYSQEFEAELGVDKTKGMDSYDYMVTYEPITIDSRFFWRARTKSGGFYWKTFDIFTQPQQSAEEVIFSLPNGLQGYALFGAWNQRRVDALTTSFAIRGCKDTSRIGHPIRLSGFGTSGAVMDHRLNNASSCMGCHADGMKRASNNIRDWMDQGGARLPKGENGVGWLDQRSGYGCASSRTLRGVVGDARQSGRRPPDVLDRWPKSKTR